MKLSLQPHAHAARCHGPVVLVIMDGIGLGAGDEADAVELARTPNLDWLRQHALATSLTAHGRAVGLPSDEDMGNSEVGHNALGAGRVFAQGASLVNAALASGRLFESAAYREAMARARAGGTLHFIGLLSDGNVHSHIRHLLQMLERAAADGAKRLAVHALLDGRDVAPHSAPEYVAQLEAALLQLRASGCDAFIASGGGRMKLTMDRYEADWDMVARGYQVHVHGNGPKFPSAQAAIDAYRAATPGITDQDLGAFVVVDASGQPRGPMRDGDAAILFNFRGDRAIEISRALGESEFAVFDRGKVPDVFFAGMMEYDGDLHIPRHALVEPPAIERTMSEYLAAMGVAQYAISETQKFGHVTYFWNGNRSGKFDEATETYVQIASDTLPFDERPWMKAAEITDALVAHMAGTNPARFYRVNYPNGDMVGHTGRFAATVQAVEAVDLQLGRLMAAAAALGGTLVVTADHGNADEMYQRRKDGSVLRDEKTGAPVAKTSHTLSPVPLYIYAPGTGSGVGAGAPGAVTASGGPILPFRLAERGDATAPWGWGLANVAATCLELLGFLAPADMERSLLRWDD